MQQFGITVEHIGHENLLHADLLQFAREVGVQRHRLHSVFLGDALFRHKIGHNVGIVTIRHFLNGAYGDGAIPPIPVGIEEFEHAINACGGTDNHRLVLVFTLFALPMEHQAKEEPAEKCQHHAEDWCDKKNGARVIQMQHEHDEAEHHNGGYRGVEHLHIELISLCHDVPVVRTAPHQTGEPHNAVQHNERPDRHVPLNRGVCLAIDQQYAHHGDQHRDDINHRNGKYEEEAPARRVAQVIGSFLAGFLKRGVVERDRLIRQLLARRFFRLSTVILLMACDYTYFLRLH